MTQTQKEKTDLTKMNTSDMMQAVAKKDSKLVRAMFHPVGEVKVVRRELQRGKSGLFLAVHP